MPDSPQQSDPPQFSWVYCAISSWLVNFMINFLLGWILVKPPLPIWGNPSFAAELIGTAFGVGFFTSVIATPQTRGAVLKGKLAGPALSDRWYANLARWPRLGITRAFAVGFATLVVFVPVPLLCLHLLEPAPLDRLDLAALKALYAASVGGLITPVIAAAAIVQAQERQRSERIAAAATVADGEASLPTVNP